MRFDVNENVKFLWRAAHILLILTDMTQDLKEQDDISEKNDKVSKLLPRPDWIK